MNLQENIQRKLIEEKQEQILEYRNLLDYTNFRLQNRQAYENLRVVLQQRNNTQRRLNSLNEELERLFVITPKRIPPII